MKTKKTEKKVYLRFALTMLLCAALGAVAGAGMVMAGKHILETSQSLNAALASLGVWWFIPGYLLLLVSTVYFFRGKTLLPRAREEDAAFREADRRLCLALILSGAAMVWLFIALGISIQAAWAQERAMWLGSQVLRLGGRMEAVLLFGSLVVQLVWITVMQVVVVKATKVIHPEKQGNVLDTKFQKDWYQSCDEAERQQIGECSYFSFRVLSVVFPLVMLALVLLAGNAMAQPTWILLVGGLWMVQQMSYQAMAYYLDHGKKKSGES